MVFVLDKHKKPLMPCSERRARILLSKTRAVVHKISPFTIRLKDRKKEDSVLQELRLKLDPGSKKTGLSILLEQKEEKKKAKVLLLGEIHHKEGISDKLKSRNAIRRGRRTRKTRYRKARFLNRKREKGWLPPSLLAHINQNLNLVRKLLKLVPLTKLSVEHVKFDTQLLQNEEIKGVEYQQGTLEGYEVREYLLEKWGRICAYCKKTNIPLQIEHIIPKSRGGSNRISNLTLACQKCNESKATKTASEFGFEQIQEQAKKPLKAAAFMNATRWNLYQSLKKLQLVVECGSGALTKRNRMAHKLPKTHYFDACCVGLSTPNEFKTFPSYSMLFKSLGRGNRQMCRTNKYGFPVALKTRNKLEKGFKTGDYVYAKVPKGKYEGNWRGIVAIRSSGYFDLKGSTQKRICQGVSYKYFTLLQLSNGWFLEKLPLNH